MNKRNVWAYVVYVNTILVIPVIFFTKVETLLAIGIYILLNIVATFLFLEDK